MQRFIKNVDTFLKFKLSVGDLFRVSEAMPQEYCNENATSALGYEDVETDATSETMDQLNTTDQVNKKVRILTFDRDSDYFNAWVKVESNISNIDVFYILARSSTTFCSNMESYAENYLWGRCGLG